MSNIVASLLGVAVDTFVRPMLELARVRAALRDLETLRSVRRAILTLCGLIACIVIMAGGAILVPLALCLFMPLDPNTRLWVALTFAGVYLAIPIVVAGFALAEKRWMRTLRLDELIKVAAAKR